MNAFEKALETLYTKPKSYEDQYWESLTAPSMSELLTGRDITDLNEIASSIKLSSKPKLKYNYIDEILKPRDFKFLASGTNRVAYKCLENQDIIIKIAFDKVGLRDSPAEYLNQFEVKSCVTRVFEVTQCGTVGLFERLVPIVNRKQFEAVIEAVYYMLTNKIIGKYIMQDIGSDYFQNYGLRKYFGPAILDFPYLYKLDGKKLSCNHKDQDTGEYCLGAIDYDVGFNNIICTKCGKRYLAKDLAKDIEKDNVIHCKRGERTNMKVKLLREGKVIARNNEYTPEASCIPKRQDMRKFIPKNYDKRSDKYDTIKKPEPLTSKIDFSMMSNLKPVTEVSNLNIKAPQIPNKPVMPEIPEPESVEVKSVSENKPDADCLMNSLIDDYINNAMSALNSLKNVSEVTDKDELESILEKSKCIKKIVDEYFLYMTSRINYKDTEENDIDTVSTNENTSVNDYNLDNGTAAPIPNPDIIQSQHEMEHSGKNEENNNKASRENPLEVDSLIIETDTEDSIADEY